MSPPSRRRGLKFDKIDKTHFVYGVASFSETWIEIVIYSLLEGRIIVASFSETWIEIMSKKSILLLFTVASFSETWIEIRVLTVLVLWK